MFPHILSLFLWFGFYNYTQQAMDFQKEVCGWLDEATLFPVNQQEVGQHHELNLNELIFPEDGKAKDSGLSFLDLPDDILDENNWMDESIDLSVLESTFQNCLVPADGNTKPEFDEINTLIDNYFQLSTPSPFEGTISPKSLINDAQSSPPSSSTFSPILEAAASSSVSILPEVGLQLPLSPVESMWSESSSVVGTSRYSDENLSDGSEVSNSSERESASPIVECYVEIVDVTADSPPARPLGKRTSRKAQRVDAQPYSLAPYQLKKESRRERKKVQNKEAAARYRVKKREQDKVLGDEVSALEDQQKSLQEKHDSLKTEIKYLKSLMREMFKARGLLK